VLKCVVKVYDVLAPLNENDERFYLSCDKISYLITMRFNLVEKYGQISFKYFF
jgi:hypothetical protein